MKEYDGGVGGVSEPELNSSGQQSLAGDPELDEALSDFRLSVCAWSDAEYAKPRIAAKPARQRSWRPAAGWALGCVLMAGGLSGGVYERHQRQEMARIAAARSAERQRLAAAQSGREEDELLAKVDSDVSREVPSAMEPLAQLMAEDEAQ